MNLDVVWNVPSLVAAIIAGLLYAPVFTWSFSHPRRRISWLVASNILWATLLMSTAQAVASVYVGDDTWYRVVSRWFFYLPFAVTLALVLRLRGR